MPKKNKQKNLPYYKIGLISVYLILGSLSILKKSASFDEIAHLSNGIVYHKTKVFGSGPHHPPLLRLIAGFSSYFSKVEIPPTDEITAEKQQNAISWSPPVDFIYGHNLFYKMHNRTGLLFFLGRFFILLLGIPLAVVLSKWAENLYGTGASIIPLTLFCLSPNILAHARTITTDFGSVSLTVIAAFFLWRFTNSLKLKDMILSSALWGITLSGKHTALFYFAVFHLSAFFLCRRKRNFIILNFLQIPILIFVINSCYFFTEPVCRNFFQPNELTALPWIFRPLFAFFSKISCLPRMYLKGILISFIHSRNGHSAYLLGQYSTQGWWYYYPVAFIVKSTFASILAVTVSIMSIAKKKITRGELFYLSPAILFALFMMNSNLNIGIRHILILWPFAFLFAGRTLKVIPGKFIKIIVILAAVENLLIFPHYISQFCILSGGAKSGYKYLGDSNLDWGQDLKILSEWWKKEGQPPLVLSYFGTSDPFYYGLKFQNCLSFTIPAIENKTINPKNPKREFLAASVTNLQGIYFRQKDIFSYFLQKKPYKRCGYSIHIYDITRDAYAHITLGAIYHSMKNSAAAERHFEKALKIDPATSRLIRKLSS
ncbi:MAG: tetratricopeptide repeat protein [bacterium]